jgi:hypothetical protein
MATDLDADRVDGVGPVRVRRHAVAPTSLRIFRID